MKILLKNQKVETIPCDVLIVNMFEGTKSLTGTTSAVDNELNGLIKKIIKEDNFKGKLGSTLTIRTQGNSKAKKIVLVGLGEKGKFDLDAVRKAYASALRQANRENAKTVSTILHGAGAGKISTKDSAEAIAEISHLALYKYDRYKSKDKKNPQNEIKTITIAETDKGKRKEAEEGIKLGNIVARAQKLARDLVTEPPLSATPTKLANVARKIAKENRLKIKVLNRNECKKLKMGAFLAVAQGSEEPPQFIEIKYTPKKPKRHIAIVGKGITFDSGGLSLKPAGSMEDMKMDMSGAAAVLGTMSAIRELKPNVAITMIVATCENMPSGKAYRPGDVVRAMNGKTIEVLNTDAEGRVTLADSLSYAAKQKPDEIIDLATLTGACVVALGDAATGVMTNNQKLADKIIKAGNEAGEKMWQLPLYDEYRQQIKSDIADMINTGSKGKAGAQNGAVLLENFVNNIPWVHLDIAGPAWAGTENPFGPKGPTGVGVRTLINYLTNYA